VRLAAECKAEAAEFQPVIDRNRCEGKADCIPACPYDVLEIGTLNRVQRAELGWRGKLKAWAHGGRQAFAVSAEACRACGDCVSACPENAIRLERQER